MVLAHKEYWALVVQNVAHRFRDAYLMARTTRAAGPVEEDSSGLAVGLEMAYHKTVDVAAAGDPCAIPDYIEA